MKNRPYTKGLWIILRGIRKPCELKSILEGRNCCQHSGEEPKINAYLDTLTAHARIKSTQSLHQRITFMEIRCNSTGFSSNDKAEKQLLACSSMTLRHPYKPICMRTLIRENCVRHYNALQTTWYDYVIKTVFGWKQNQMAISETLSPRRNGFYLWKKSVFPKEDIELAVLRWHEQPDDVHAFWEEGEERYNASVKEKARRYRDKLVEFKSRLGPLGSAHPHIHIRDGEIYQLTSQPESAIVDYWRRSSLGEWKKRYDIPVNPHEPTTLGHSLVK